MQFLSQQWIERYARLWNEHPELVRGLEGFSALIEYGWDPDERPSAFLVVENGRATASYFASAPRSPDFVMRASEENWRRLRQGSLSGRAALLTKKLKFKGSMITAMKYMNAFNKSIELIGRVERA